MNAKERAIDALECWRNGLNISTESLFNLLHTAFTNADDLNKAMSKARKIWSDPVTEKIQGYNAEQWQEIIDGGYLCEFEGAGGSEICLLKELKDGPFNFVSAGRGVWNNCRPAQIKGVMRPIFVEPVDKKAGYVFFDRRGSYLGTSNFFTGATWNETIGCCMKSDSIPTKYIEV